MSTKTEAKSLFGLSNSELSDITGFFEQGSNMKVLVAGKLKSDIEYVRIIIPLWFNIIKTYMVFMESSVLLVTKTLWRGMRDVYQIPYTDIYSIVVEAKNKSLRNVTDSKIIIRMNDGDMIKFETSNHNFVNAVNKLSNENIPLVKQ
jgi:hypothetical protein